MSRGKKNIKAWNQRALSLVSPLWVLFLCLCTGRRLYNKESREHTLELKHYTAALSVICASYFGDNPLYVLMEHFVQTVLAATTRPQNRLQKD